MKKFIVLFTSIVMMYALLYPVQANSSTIYADTSNTTSFNSHNYTTSTELETHPVFSGVSTPVHNILSAFHSKNIEIATFNEESLQYGASNESLRLGNSVLALETVTELNDAGYEAYHVTDFNYDEIEQTMQCKLSDLGMGTGGSYIITIGNGFTNESANQDIRPNVFSPSPSEDIFDGVGHIVYYHNGIPYTMRYVTITSTDESCLFVSTTYSLSNINNISNYVDDILSATLSITIDELLNGIPLSTVLSLLGDWTTDDNLTIVSPGDIEIYAGTAWTREYIQIWDSTNEVWHTAQCSAYAISKVRCVGGYIYNSEMNAPEFICGPEKSTTTYSPKYFNTDLRQAEAVEAYLIGTKFHDCTGNIKFYFTGNDGTINFSGNSNPLFQHRESLAYLLPLITED